MSKVTWVHLSDFHFKTDNLEKHNQGIVLESLREDLERCLKNIVVDFIIITGDLAYSGKEEEYTKAKIFLTSLLKLFGLKKNRLFIVPGNHDVNRKKIDNCVSRIPLDDRGDINDLLINEDVKKIFFKKLEEYGNFINRNKFGEFDYNKNYFWTRAIQINGRTVGLLGLNSAINSHGDKDKNKLFIGEAQVLAALKEIKKADLINGVDLMIAAFHHPLEWLQDGERNNDRDVVMQNLGGKCQFILHGHTHKQGFTKTSNPDYEVVIIPAGSVYTERKKKNSYNYVTYDFEKGKGKVYMRQYLDSIYQWVDDNTVFRNANDGVFEFSLRLSQPPLTLKFPVKYRDWLTKNCRYMDLKNLMFKEGVELKDVFIKLEAIDNQSELIDIEDLVREYDSLLIEGQAGSGKTTLLKHIAFSIIDKSYGRKFNDYLPVLVFFKDLQYEFDTVNESVANAGTAKKVIANYFSSMGLDIKTIDSYCNADKAIFLLDGLDEIEIQPRDALIEFIVNRFSCRMVLTGRSQGIDETVLDRFGKNHIKIHSLNMKQVEDFIRKWFSFFFSGELKINEDILKRMLEGINAQPNINELINNPLFLTLVCVLYSMNDRLPKQQSELYKKFIENLIYHHCDNETNVNEFLMTLAYRNHIERQKIVFDYSFAQEVMKEIYPSQKRETEQDYNNRILKKFEEIGKKYGLVKLEKEKYNFWHLRFQAFLAAQYFLRHKLDYTREIKDYWGIDWYKEFVEFFIGILSIDNMGWANQIILKEFERSDNSPFKGLRLAAGTLLCMHKDDREGLTLDKARENLLSILEKENDTELRAEVGEVLGRLGDPRDLTEFIELKDFEIGKYPVTNQWYKEFISVGGYENKDYWTPEGKKWLREIKDKFPKYWNESTWNCPNFPVVGVSWDEAVAFCNWHSLIDQNYKYRLPKEAEWLATAAGDAKRKYPWGDDDVDINRCNYDWNFEKTSAVGIFELGKTPRHEIYDLAGNIWEWCLDEPANNFSNRVLRGGSWRNSPKDVECVHQCVRQYFDKRDRRSRGIGFRLVRERK